MKDRAYYQKVKEGEHLIIVSCITASGKYMTPVLIFSGQSVSVISTYGFSITASPNGWIDSKIKLNWLKEFIKYIDTNKKNLLLLDGHSSNLDPDFIELAKQHNIIVMVFPANCTHLLQPLDSNYFRILKDQIRKKLPVNKLENKWDICRILADPFYYAGAPGTIEASFSIPGIFPVCWKLDDYFSKKSKTEILDQKLNPPPTTETSFKPVTNPGIQFSRKETITIQSSQVSFSQETAQTSCVLANMNSLIPINLNPLVPINSNSLVQINSNYLIPINSNSLVPINSSSSPTKNALFQIVTKIMIDNEEIKQKNQMIYQKLDEIKPKKRMGDTRLNTKTGVILTSDKMNISVQQKKKRKLENELKEINKTASEKEKELELVNL